ncbi:MAG: DUF4352 domain-containing protein [Acidobacteriia bacterium]|nr:DUF4352 domain-containing protein [Terriglobia bacterium]
MRHIGVCLVIAASAAFFPSSCSRQEPAERVITYELGQKVEVGHVIYTVFEAKWENQLGQGPTARLPQYRYFLVRISVVNSGAAEQIMPNLTIEDDNGNSYSEVSNGDGVAQWIGFLRSVKPAEAAQGYLLFDAPPKHYKLRVVDESGERTALVDIPLKFDSDAPVLSVPETTPKK